MLVSATVRNSPQRHEVEVCSGVFVQRLDVPLQSTGRGSGVNGGEFLMLALATCYCNDLYREADRLEIPIDSVEVEASAQFSGIGLAATNIKYRARVVSTAPAPEIAELIRQTDSVAEIHNTVRSGVPVELVD